MATKKTRTAARTLGTRVLHTEIEAKLYSRANGFRAANNQTWREAVESALRIYCEIEEPIAVGSAKGGE